MVELSLKGFLCLPPADMYAFESLVCVSMSAYVYPDVHACVCTHTGGGQSTLDHAHIIYLFNLFIYKARLINLLLAWSFLFAF